MCPVVRLARHGVCSPVGRAWLASRCTRRVYMAMLLTGLVALVALVAGAVASIVGFGIGSLLTPTLALIVPMKTAVAAVAIPHVAGTALRCWRLRHEIDRRVFWSFGITSALGGLAGALLHGVVGSRGLTAVFAVLLIFAGAVGLTGLEARLRFRGAIAWIAGLASGVFGGLVGNQGGIRSAAMLGISVPRDAFVATATATALLVDFARVPVYLAYDWAAIVRIGGVVAVAVAGVLLGTLLGGSLLQRIPERLFRRIVSLVVFVLGIYEAMAAITVR